MCKKAIGLLLALAAAFALSACASTEAGTSGVPQNTAPASSGAQTPQDAPVSAALAPPQPVQSGSDAAPKAAIVYFSATGTTEKIAELIAQETGAALFEIIPQEEYTAEDLNYHDSDCRANREMNDDAARPAIENDLRAAAGCDIVYLGYPIWWGTAPRIIQTFLENYDLSGATVYTFCTSGGSGAEQSVQDLQNAFPGISIVSGTRLNGAEQPDIQEWLNNLN